MSTSRAITVTGTFTVATKYVNNFIKAYATMVKYIPSNHNKEYKILEKNKRMAPLNRGAWISLTDIDLEVPQIISSDDSILVGFSTYPKKGPFKSIVLPGSPDFKIKRNNEDIGSGLQYYYFLKSTPKGDAIISYTYKKLFERFGNIFANTCYQWVSHLLVYETSTTERELREYSIDNIYSAAKSVTKNWTEWEKGKVSHEIFEEITKGNTLPVNVKEVRNALKNIVKWYEHSNNNMCKDVCSSIIDSDGSYRSFFAKNEIGPLAYAIYAWEKEKNEKLLNQKNPGRHLKVTMGTPISAEGQLYYKGQSDNGYGMVNNYILEATDGNYYFLNTTVDLEELTSGRKFTEAYRISGKLGPQWTSRGREYYGVNFNNIKGKLKIEKLS